MNKQISLGGQQLVDAVISILKEKLAEDIVVIDLHAVSGSADMFVICQGDNSSHTRAMAEEILRNLKGSHTHPYHYEGLEEGRWVLIDYSDVVVHIMLPELREYYNLESLWSEGEITKIEP